MSRERGVALADSRGILTDRSRGGGEEGGACPQWFRRSGRSSNRCENLQKIMMPPPRLVVPIWFWSGGQSLPSRTPTLHLWDVQKNHDSPFGGGRKPYHSAVNAYLPEPEPS